ncbi:MAG: sigma-70 family RNA polymerase sigma factor [Candidatus Bipolaricaulis sp.]|nr:sigma-70 family RNA polymerase sigma factor [Candidatus Bipolaricaulis sp.]
MAETKGKRAPKPKKPRAVDVDVPRDEEKEEVLVDETDDEPAFDEEAAGEDEDGASDDAIDEELADPEDLLGDDDPGDEEPSSEAEAPARKRPRPTGWEGADSSNRREDPVKTYLREIGKVPLLTKEGEVTLAKAMEIGAYAELSIAKAMGADAEKRLKKVKDLTDEERAELEILKQKGKEAAELRETASFEEKLGGELPTKATREELEALVREGRAARDRLTISNLRLVVSIAKRYMNRGLSLLDLIQEGNMGLMKAVEKFDFSRGYKFSTYATWWIRQAITRAIADQSRTIRVPVHMIETVRELNRVKREYIQSHGTAPTLEDLSLLTGMSIDKIKKVESVSQYTASLERPIGEEDEDTLGDFIEDPSSPSPTKETFRMFLREQLSRALDQLDEREREILKLRYGLEDGHPRTLKDVSLKFNITRERVRQIEIKAIEKLKHPSRRAELRKFRELLMAED